MSPGKLLAAVAIKQIVSSYENILQQQEKVYSETVEQREAEKVWIDRQQQKLEQVQKGIEEILNQSVG